AHLLEDPDSPVDINADPVRGVLIFKTTAHDLDRARDDIQIAAARAEATLYSAIGYQQYSLRAVGSMRAVTAQQHSPLTTFLGAGIGVAVT
ncbi:polymerase, partial [Mycobacterium sp. ITM-2017-0098]